MVLLVCSCGGNTDTSTDTTKETVDETDTSIDTNTDTDSSVTDTDTDVDTNTDSDSQGNEVDLNDGKYRIFVCDEDGNGLASIFVQYCTEEMCLFDYTDANGYIVVPSNEYHVALVVDEAGVYQGATYDASNYPVFEGDSKIITIILTK
jgi:hypothetical protein